MHQSACDSANEQRVRELELDSVVDRRRRLGLLEHRVELRRLRDGTWEPIEDETAIAQQQRKEISFISMY